MNIKPPNNSTQAESYRERDALYDIISSHRNTEIKELKKGVYKFFQGKLKQKNGNERDIDSTINLVSGTIKGGLISSKALLRSEEDYEKMSDRIRRKEFIKKNSIFCQLNLVKEEESENDEIEAKNDTEKKNFNNRVQEKRYQRMGPKIDFGLNKIKNIQGDEDTPHEIKIKKRRRKTSHSKQLIKEKINRRRERIKSSYDLRKMVDSRFINNDFEEFKNMHYNAHNLIGLKHKKKNYSTIEKVKNDEVSGILKPCSFVKMREIKEELEISQKFIEKRVEKLRERANKKVKFNKQMLVYKYKAKRSLSEGFENINC